MKIFRITGFIVMSICVLAVIATIGYRSLTLAINASPTFAQAVQNLMPRFFQNETQIVIFDNPLVNQEGFSVEDVKKRSKEFLGVEITVKGAISDLDEELGFTIKDTSNVSGELLIITDESITEASISAITLEAHKYVRVRGIVKELIVTTKDSLDDIQTEDGKYKDGTPRIVVVAKEISPIIVAE